MLKKRDVLVAICTPHYFGDGYHSWDEVHDCNGEPLRCRFTNDPSAAESADALWFHAPSLSLQSLLLRRSSRPGQKRVLMSMESAAHYPALADERFLQLFDLHMTYRLDSDVPVVYPGWAEYGSFREPPLSIEAKRAAGACALYVQSNRVPYRDRYVRRLMREIAIHAPGKCLNNRRLADLVGGASDLGRGDAAVVAALRHYKFALTFENSRATDYVTERLFRALAAGAVPIYWGAPNVREFLPSPNAAILVDDYSSPRELARDLRTLDRDDAAYASLLAWKTAAFAPRFAEILALSHRDSRLRLCVKLAHGCGRECGCGGRLREPTRE